MTVAAFIYLLSWLSAQDQSKTQQPIVADAAQSGQNSAPPAGDLAEKATDAAAAAEKPGDTAEVMTAGVKEPEKSEVKLSFVGDVMFAGNVESLLKKNGWDFPYAYVKDDLDKADITVANLETPVSTKGTAQFKEYVYRSSPLALPDFKAAGFDVVTTSNNHILDYGPDAMLDTLDELDKVGIKHTGTGHNNDEAYSPVIMEKNGFKIAFLGFSRIVPETSWFAGADKPGLAESYSVKQALEAISKAREQADLVVVLAHWGTERTDKLGKEQTNLAHQYIDQGADLVIGSHPHVLQGFEQYNGKWIAYSLGNFIFTTNNEPNTWETMMLNAACTKERSCQLQMTPMLTKGAQPVRMEDEEGAKLLDKMSHISVNAQVDPEGKVTAAASADSPSDDAAEIAPAVKSPAPNPAQKASAKSAIKQGEAAKGTDSSKSPAKSANTSSSKQSTAAKSVQEKQASPSAASKEKSAPSAASSKGKQAEITAESSSASSGVTHR